MNDRLRLAGKEVAHAEVHSCMDEATRVRELEPGEVAEGVACVLGAVGVGVAVAAGLGTYPHQDSALDSDPKRPRKSTSSSPKNDGPVCVVRSGKETFHVLVDRCLEEKGFKVLLWR